MNSKEDLSIGCRVDQAFNFDAISLIGHRR